MTAAWEDASQSTQTTTTCSTNMKQSPTKEKNAANILTAIHPHSKAMVSVTALSAINARPNAHPMNNAQKI